LIKKKNKKKDRFSCCFDVKTGKTSLKGVTLPHSKQVKRPVFIIITGVLGTVFKTKIQFEGINRNNITFQY